MKSEWNPELTTYKKREKKMKTARDKEMTFTGSCDWSALTGNKRNGMTRSKWKVENNNLSGAKVMIKLLTLADQASHLAPGLGQITHLEIGG